VDDDGEVRPVILREYQKRHILEMLQVTRHINGSDTGLGKTLEMLSTIGYIWLKEPEYVPIVLTKKSALHQWAAEVNKFMQNMEAVVIDGGPYERNSAYTEFFNNYDNEHKRLLIMTYDTLLRDASESVIRKSDHKASPADKKELVKARKILKETKTAVTNAINDFESWFNARPYEIWDHAKTVTAASANRKSRSTIPNNWSSEDEQRVQRMLKLLETEKTWKLEVDRLETLVHPTILAMGILGHVRTFRVRHPEAKLMLVMDEAHVVKNYRGKIHAAAADLAKNCERVYGLTATPVKNRLMEFFALFRIVVPGLFPKVTWFQNEFCVTKLQRIGGGRSVPIVVGYKNLDRFVQIIEPFYLSRRKYDVAAELPRLVTRELQCELTDLQEELYDMAEAGLLAKDADPDESPAAVLGAMTFVQEAVDAPSLLNNDDGEPWEGESPKIKTLLEMLEDELDGVKTIVFSRFERMISLTEQALKDKGIRCVRITGKENKAADREKTKQIFQDPKSGVDIILITEAGSESINLQAAEHFVLLDSPWSWGTYLQLIGRMIRIGSKHPMTVATHLVGVRQDGRKTIDHYVIKKLRSKKALADKVAGEGLKDGLRFVPEDDAMEIVSMIKAGSEDPKKALKSKRGVGVVTKTRNPGKAPSRVKEGPLEPKAVIIDLSEIDI
jgi:SNF2 family DNA or RNA helicase